MENEQRSGMESSTPTTSSVRNEITEVAGDEPSSETQASAVNKLMKYQLKVKMCCVKCEEKVVEGIREVYGVFAVRVDRMESKVVLVAMPSGLDERKVLRKARKVDKNARFVELDGKEMKKPEVDNKRISNGNPFIEELLKAYPVKEVSLNYVAEDLSTLKLYLRTRLGMNISDRNSSIPKFLEDNDTKSAKQEVEELFYLFEASEFLINNRLPEQQPAEANLSVKDAKTNILAIEIYYQLFLHALRDKGKRPGVSFEEKKKSKKRRTHSDFMVSENPLQYYEATEFMVFLINKAQGEEHIMSATSVAQTTDASKILITKCIHRYEKETIAVCIYHLLGKEFEEAEDLFKNIIKYMKPSDISNRGRVYNYALRKAEKLSKLGRFLVSGCLSQRYSVPRSEVLRRFGMGLDDRVIIEVHNFFVKLFLADEELMRRKDQLTFAWMKEHDYPYLIKCLWDCYDINNKPSDCFKLCTNDIASTDAPLGKWTKVQPYVEYALHSGASSVAGLDIIHELFGVWSELDVNAPYYGVTALHVAAYRGDEKLVEYLLRLQVYDFDINVRTGRLVEGKSGTLQNQNRWKMPAYQTALHIATARGQAKVVKLLCDTSSHRHIMRFHEEDEEERTALDIIYDNLKKAEKNSSNDQASLKEIEKTLLSLPDVQKGIDRLYRNRQVSVDAANTILVGAALIAGVTFAGWLQPPLGYAQYYDFPTPPPAPSGTYDSYIGVQGNVGIQVFAIFNSLSFFFAIATVIVGADAAFPMSRYEYIGHVVATMQLLLRRAIKFLIISLVCVLGAFGSAAVVILPPHVYFRKHLVLSIIIGGGVCGVVLWQLLTRHWKLMRDLNADIIEKISTHTNIF